VLAKNQHEASWIALPLDEVVVEDNVSALDAFCDSKFFVPSVAFSPSILAIAVALFSQL
jgi:hypothetical protein